MFEEINVKKISKVALILSWIILLFYFFLKIFFGYEINLVCENERILALCNFVDNNLIANYIVSSAFCFVLMYLYYGAILRKIKLSIRETIVTLITVLIANIFTYFGIFDGLISDLLKLFITPIFILNKFSWKIVLSSLIAFAFNFSFQLLSVITTNIGFNYTRDSMLLSMMLSIDTLIMLIICCLYRKEWSK